MIKRIASFKTFFTFELILFFLFSAALSASQKPWHILLTNDDGIKAPGIQALFTRLTAIGQVTVAAPSTNQSTVGHGLTFHEPIMVENWESGGATWFSISARPATCVRLALTSLLDEMPDLVISGINRGENVGMETYSSGTVACVREAAFHGIPGLAISIQVGKIKDMDYEAAARFVVTLLKDINQSPLPPGVYLNINYPALPQDQVKGVLVTRQDLRPSDERFEKRINPAGKAYFWSLYQPLANGPQESDTWAIYHGYISITPLQCDQTYYPGIETLKLGKLAGQKR
jgi:5'-nucleotidase